MQNIPKNIANHFCLFLLSAQLVFVFGIFALLLELGTSPTQAHTHAYVCMHEHMLVCVALIVLVLRSFR